MKFRIFIYVVAVFLLSGCFFGDKKEQVNNFKENQQVIEEKVEGDGTASKGSEDSTEVEVATGEDDKEAGEKNSDSPESTEEQQSTEQTNVGNKKDETKSGAVKEPSKNTSGADDSSSAKPPVTVTEEQIKQKYKQELLSLQSYYSGKLGGLTSAAIGELKTGDKNAIFSKYAGIGMSLKSESEAKVNQTLFQMEKELKANSLPTSSVSEFRQTYYSVMDSTSNSAFNEIRVALGL